MRWAERAWGAALLSLSGCLAIRGDLGAVAAFDPLQPAHPEGHANLDVGLTTGVVAVTAGVHSRPSTKGFELNIVPQGCLTLPILDTPFGVGGCLGVTVIGAGARQGSPTLLIGGTAAEAYLMTPLEPGLDWRRIKNADEEVIWFFRAGLRSGLDVRAGNEAFMTPYVGGFAGLELWFGSW